MGTIGDVLRALQALVNPADGVCRLCGCRVYHGPECPAEDLRGIDPDDVLNRFDVEREIEEKESEIEDLTAERDRLRQRLDDIAHVGGSSNDPIVARLVELARTCS